VPKGRGWLEEVEVEIWGIEVQEEGWRVEKGGGERWETGREGGGRGVLGWER